MSTTIVLSAGELIVESTLSLQKLKAEVTCAEWVSSEGFASQARRAEWLSVRVLLRRELKRRGVELGSDNSLIEYLPSGAPIINPLLEANLNISISHCPGYVALLLSQQRCAVDIEHSSRRVEHLLTKFASPHELSLGVSPIALWCAKEALYKILGREGLCFIDDLRVDSIVKESDGVTLLDCTIAPDTKQRLSLYTVEQLTIAVAISQ